MVVYCLFCITQQADAIARRFEQSGSVRAISPHIIQRKWVKGKPHEESHHYLPGYVFIYMQEELDVDLHVEGVIKVLGNAPLSGNDLAFAEMLYAKNGIIGSVKVLQAGDRLKLLKGPMNGFEGEIVKVDRHQTRLKLKYVFDSVVRYVWVGYDMADEQQMIDESLK